MVRVPVRARGLCVRSLLSSSASLCSAAAAAGAVWSRSASKRERLLLLRSLLSRSTTDAHTHVLLAALSLSLSSHSGCCRCCCRRRHRRCCCRWRCWCSRGRTRSVLSLSLSLAPSRPASATHTHTHTHAASLLLSARSSRRLSHRIALRASGSQEKRGERERTSILLLPLLQLQSSLLPLVPSRPTSTPSSLSLHRRLFIATVTATTAVDRQAPLVAPGVRSAHQTHAVNAAAERRRRVS